MFFFVLLLYFRIYYLWIAYSTFWSLDLPQVLYNMVKRCISTRAFKLNMKINLNDQMSKEAKLGTNFQEWRMKVNFNKWQVYRPSYVPDVLVISIPSNKTTLAYHDMWYSKNYTVNCPKSFCGTSLFDFMLVKSCNRKSVMRIFCNMIIQFYYATLLYFATSKLKNKKHVLYMRKSKQKWTTVCFFLSLNCWTFPLPLSFVRIYLMSEYNDLIRSGKQSPLKSI